jgi:hypothetical protein
MCDHAIAGVAPGPEASETRPSATISSEEGQAPPAPEKATHDSEARALTDRVHSPTQSRPTEPIPSKGPLQPNWATPAGQTTPEHSVCAACRVSGLHGNAC